MKRGLLVFVVAGLFLASCAAPLQDNSTLLSIDPGREFLDGLPDESYSRERDDVVSEYKEQDPKLDEMDTSGILFMREEEKLAKDVYLQLADLWGMNIFSNIASSEDKHMEAVLYLINMADLDDPAQGMEVGEFLNQDLQSLYDTVVARGAESLSEALLVGGAIEEIDILDLQEYLAETDDIFVSEVYQNLLKGSINHLNSFVRTYERQTGEEYHPQFLTEDAYKELLRAISQGGGGFGQGRSDQPRGRGQAN